MMDASRISSDLMNSQQPRRSVLYMPGSNQRALEKAQALPADVLILDLEDAVSPEQKSVAREYVSYAVRENDYGDREVTVRINGLESPWGEADLIALADLIKQGANIDGIVIPKAQSVQQIQDVLAVLHNQGVTEIPLWLMIETPLGVLQSQALAEIAQISVLVMGTNDLSKELRVPQTQCRDGFITSLGMCVLAARAYGKAIIDGVFIHLNDQDGLLASCEQGKRLGFDGKTLIHPKQLEAANGVFAPSEQEVDEANALVSAWNEAIENGKGVVVVNGRLVEELHVIEAQRILAQFDLIRAKDNQ